MKRGVPMRTNTFLRTSTRLMAEPALESGRDGADGGAPGGEGVGEGEGDVGVAGGVGVDVRRPEGGVREGLADARLGLVAGLHLGELRMVARAAHGEQGRLDTGLAAEVVVERRIHLRLGVALRIELVHHVAASVGVERVDGFIDDAEAEVGTDGLAGEVTGDHVVRGGLLRLEDILRRGDLHLELLLCGRNFQNLAGLIENVVADEERVDGDVGLRVGGDGQIEGEGFAVCVHDLAKLYGVALRDDEGVEATGFGDDAEVGDVAGRVGFFVGDDLGGFGGVVPACFAGAHDPKVAFVEGIACAGFDGGRGGLDLCAAVLRVADGDLAGGLACGVGGDVGGWAERGLGCAVFVVMEGELHVDAGTDGFVVVVECSDVELGEVACMHSVVKGAQH